MLHQFDQKPNGNIIANPNGKHGKMKDYHK